MKTLLLSVFSIFTLLGCQAEKTIIDTKTVDQLELTKYLGTWYEIARFQHSFEKDLVGVTATYNLRDDGKIEVVNSGYKNTLDGEYTQATGKAKIPNPSKPGQLKVAFFLFFYADYNVLVLDSENYQYALIGSSTPKYLWILSRTPQMDEATYNMLVEEARKRGYDTGLLFKVPQKQ